MLAANRTDANQVIVENLPTAAEVAAANTYELAEMDAWLRHRERSFVSQCAAEGARRQAGWAE